MNTIQPKLLPGNFGFYILSGGNFPKVPQNWGFTNFFSALGNFC